MKKETINFDDKAINKAIYIALLFFILLISVAALITIYSHLTMDYDCLEEAAKDYCKSINKKSDSFANGYFTCKKNERETIINRFAFTEEEIRRCKK